MMIRKGMGHSIKIGNKFLDYKLCNMFMLSSYKYIVKKDYSNLFCFNSTKTFSNDNKVFIKRNIVDVVPDLCKEKSKEHIISNLIFFIINLLHSKNVTTVEEYKTNINKIYYNLINVYYKIFENDENNPEYIFVIFNDELIKSVSPSLKKKKKNIIQELVLNSLQFFFKNNVNYKNKLDSNLLCEIIDYKNFFYVINNLFFEKMKIKEQLTVRNLDYLFFHFLNDKPYLYDAINLAALFWDSNCADTNGVGKSKSGDSLTISIPFKKSSEFNCITLLDHIVKLQSKNFFFLFLDKLKNKELKKQVFRYLLVVDRQTGLFYNYWAYLSIKEYVLSKDEKLKEAEIEQVNNCDNLVEKRDCTKRQSHILQVGGEHGDACRGTDSSTANITTNIIANNNTDSTAKSNEYYILPEDMKQKIIIINNLEDLKKMIVHIKNAQETHWINHIYNNENIYNIRPDNSNNLIVPLLMIDTIYINLRNKKKLFYIAMDIEWCINKEPSVFSLSTDNKIYVINLLNIDYKYKELICNFFKWLLENPFIYKLFYNFPSDLKIMTMFFQSISSIYTYVNVIDLKDPLIVHNNYNTDIKKKCSNNNSNKIMNIEFMNRNIIQNDDINLFKNVTNSNSYKFNKEMKNNFSDIDENIINVLPKKNINKIYFKNLNQLCYKFLNKNLNKKFQLSNWKKRPLTNEQIEYAGLDSYVLIKIEKQLIDKNYITTYISNSNVINDIFVQKYRLKNCQWEKIVLDF
ncbi:exonuclease, putative [Hepatocystis sp. ex Piliocolobus tephrosceles]|nr:exonuclease, putative [Hepatocystis sp. ex Piliocolobus tephrosceles]